MNEGWEVTLVLNWKKKEFVNIINVTASFRLFLNGVNGEDPGFVCGNIKYAVFCNQFAIFFKFKIMQSPI
jgi:hypothetical protein